jgi:hypothetical protein
VIGEHPCATLSSERLPKRYFGRSVGWNPKPQLLLLQTHDTGIHYNAVTTPRFVDSAFALLADLENCITPPSYWWICDHASSASLCLVTVSHFTQSPLDRSTSKRFVASATAAVCDFGQFFGLSLSLKRGRIAPSSHDARL